MIAAENNEVDRISDELANWQLFEFLPTDTTGFASQNKTTISSNTDKMANLDQFFASFPHEICKLNLLQKDTDSILKLCSTLVKNVNELNSILISDFQNLPPLQVNCKIE